jgi:hydrogenase/urease accessory protein HupE
MARLVLAFVGVFALTLAITTVAFAHGTVSATIDLHETAPGRAVLRVRTSRPEDRVTAAFDEGCQTEPGEEEGAQVWVVRCDGGLSGHVLGVRGLGPVVSEAIVVAELDGARRISRVLTVEDPSFELPAAQPPLALAASYVRLGVGHVLSGADHLLFLLGLVLLLREPKAILLAETAFTVSHSLSFSATALGLVHVSAPAAEAAIALSLVLLALDVGRTDKPTGARQGAALAFVFGLVHGLGFAGGLAEIGLPDHDAVFALIGFAGGVELGQVAFLIAAFAGLALLRHRSVREAWRALSNRHPIAARFALEPLLAVVMGALSTSWLLERARVCLFGT